MSFLVGKEVREMEKAEDRCSYNFIVASTWTANTDILNELQKKLAELIEKYRSQNIEAVVEDWTITRTKIQGTGGQ